MRVSKNIYLLIFAVFIALIQGCGIFDTRDPEDPATIRSTYFPPTSAEIVIDNLEYAIQEKNSDNYSKCISNQSFKFSPDSRTLQVWGQLFDSWNQQTEKQYFDNLINLQEGGNSTAVLFLDNQSMVQINSDSAQFQADYIFVFQHNRINLPKSSRGRMNLVLATDDNALFYIRRWEDFRMNDTDFTWSEFKANFSN